jgi:3-oxoacyl-[acyl-carrier-protein] synthase II
LRRVVVTGLGAVSPCGLDAPSTWSGMVEGRSGIGPITRFDATGWSCQVAGQVEGFDGAALCGKRDVRRMDLFMQYAVVAGEEAVRDSGLDPSTWQRERVGVYVGTGIGGLIELASGFDGFAKRGPKGLSPFFIPRSLANLAGGWLAMRLGCEGPNLAMATACASGTHSIGEAWRAIRCGDAEVILAGGAEAPVLPEGVAGFMVMRALTGRSDPPEEACVPFDARRDGFVIGEGAGVLVLEEYEHARARGARIYAELVGYGNNCDAHHLTAPSPGGIGASRCMDMALRSARLNPTDVDYVNAHGTSTPANDKAETQAIHTSFGDHARSLMVSSTKAVTGHLLGAAGGVEALATVKALHEQTVPPTATWRERDPDCDLDYVPRDARATRVRAALCNSFGFGGVNACLAFSRIQD